MAKSDQMRRVYIDDIPLNVPETTSPQNLIQLAGQNPGDRDLVYKDPDGSTEILPKRRIIKPKNGERFESQITAREG